MLDKAIESGDEHRKQYIRRGASDRSCRNHGSCSWCKGNRTHKNKKRIIESKYKLKELE